MRENKRRCSKINNKSVVSGTNFDKTTMTTPDIISRAMQWIYLDIEHGYDQRMRENLQTYRL